MNHYNIETEGLVMNQDRLLREYVVGEAVLLLTWYVSPAVTRYVAPAVLTAVLWVELLAWRLARGWG